MLIRLLIILILEAYYNYILSLLLHDIKRLLHFLTVVWFKADSLV